MNQINNYKENKIINNDIKIIKDEDKNNITKEGGDDFNEIIVTSNNKSQVKEIKILYNNDNKSSKENFININD